MSYKTLGELVNIKGGKRLPKGAQLQSEPNSHPYIRVRDMGGKYIPEHGLEYVPDDVFPSISRYIVNTNDVIISIVGTIGLVSIIDERFDNASQTENCAKLSGLDYVDANYVYYFLNSSVGQQEIRQGTVGAVQAKLPLYSIEKIKVYWPARFEREKIVDQLATIDRKLDLNVQTNQTLEQMAQAIFKSWFVDFDPVKAKINGEQPEGMDAATASLFPEKLVESELGLIPEGWEVGDLSDLMDFNPKRTLKKGTIAPYLDMKNMPTSGHLALDIYDREMGSGTKFKNGDSLLARITPCLENGKTAYVDFLEDEQVGWGSTEYIVMRSKSDSYKYFSYYMARFEPFRKFAIQSMTGTSGRQRAQAQTVQTMPFAIPPISILEKFDAFIAPNMQMIKSHGSENRTLANLRDTLLPKLLSGEIELETNER